MIFLSSSPAFPPSSPHERRRNNVEEADREARPQIDRERHCTFELPFTELHVPAHTKPTSSSLKSRSSKMERTQRSKMRHGFFHADEPQRTWPTHVHHTRKLNAATFEPSHHGP